MKKQIMRLIVGTLTSIISGIVLLFLGNTFFAAQNKGPEKIVSDSPVLDFKINYVYRLSGRGAFKPLSNGGIMHSGDHYKIIFTPTESCYVYIFQTDSSGMIYGVFPLQNFRGVTVNLSNPVQANQDYYIPSRDQSFVLDEQLGTEKFYFLAFQQRDLELEKQSQEVLAAQNQDDKKQMQLAQKAMTITLKDKGIAKIITDPAETETVSWKEDGQAFSVLRQRLEGMCNGCVQILTFTHQ